MPPQNDPDLQQRLELLMKQVVITSEHPTTQAPDRSNPIARLLFRIPMLAAVGMAFALLIGIQLGALPWRYRRELWQAQGAALGLVVGLAIGHHSARRKGSDDRVSRPEQDL